MAAFQVKRDSMELANDTSCKVGSKIGIENHGHSYNYLILSKSHQM